MIILETLTDMISSNRVVKFPTLPVVLKSLRHSFGIVVAVFMADQALIAGPPTDAVVAANNAFTIDLFRQVAKTPGNIIVSPLSADTTLTMIYAGARGETAQQMAAVLHYSSDDTNAATAFATLLKQLKSDSREDLDASNSLAELQREKQEWAEIARTMKGTNIQFVFADPPSEPTASDPSSNDLEIANSVWFQKGYPVSESFGEALHNQYDTTLNAIDLTGWPGPFDPGKAALARDTIDRWAAAQTHGKIADAVPPGLPDADTRLVLANAVYFKGSWDKPFDRSGTTNSLFYFNDSQFVSVPMMHGGDTCNYYEDDKLQIIEKRYSSGGFSMAILLPKAKDGLAEIESQLTAQMIYDLHEAGYSSEVAISLPGFRETADLDLTEPLQNLGMKDAFDFGADFSDITSEKPFFIRAVLQRACVDVNEEGTVAAAVTSALMGRGIPMEFNADHPFLFWIRDNVTGALLFIGRVENPLEEGS